MWWWGQQEAVGIQTWMDDTIKKFKAQTGSSVDATLMDTSQVIPQFTKAAAAGNVPDVQFLFNGIYHMENVWLGYLKPLNGLVSAATIKNGGGTSLSNYAGQVVPHGLLLARRSASQYNKEHFDKAGPQRRLAADDVGRVHERLRQAQGEGLHRRSRGGIKDGFLGEWWLVNSLTQNLNSAADALNLFIGKLDWRDPKYHEHWVKLQELYDDKYWNDDVTSLNLYQGIQLYNTGKASMALNNTPALPNSQKKLGKDNVGFMKLPTFGTGKMAPYPDRRHAGLRHPDQGEGSRDGGEVHRLHALARAPQGVLDALEADPGRRALRPERDQQPADQADLQEVRRRPSTTSTSPTSCPACSGPTRCS